MTIVPEKWYHVCVSYERTYISKAHIKMFFDGIPLINKKVHSPTDSTLFNLNPTWRLGYCKESLLDPTVEITRGSIRDFSVWSRALTNDEMLTFTTECSIGNEGGNLFKADVIDWKSITINQTGANVQVKFTSFKQKDRLIFKSHCNTIEHKEQKENLFPVCKSEDLVKLILPNKMTFEDATLTCQQLGGVMPLPRNSRDIEELTTFANNGQILNDGGNMDCTTFWLPIKQLKKIKSNGTKQEGDENYDWIHLKYNNEECKNPVKFLPWELGQPNGLEFQQCVIMAPETRLYYDVDCKETQCFFCSVCNQLHFSLRGLSQDLSKGNDNRNGIDSRYIYIPKPEKTSSSSQVQLEGYYDHKISLNARLNRWEILRVDNSTVGTLSTERHYPFGKHVWNVDNAGVFEDVSASSGNSKKKKVLKLSLVILF
jgi:hypothetical protein